MRNLRILVLIVAIVFLVAGCQIPANSGKPLAADSGADNGIADLPAERIAEAAVSSLTHNYPMRIKGRFADDSGAAVLTFDMVRNFSDGRGTVQVDGYSLEIIRLRGHDYAKADAAFWIARGPAELQHSDAAARVGGKWVRGELYSSKLPVGRFLDFHDNLWEALANDTTFTKGERTVVNGVPAIACASGNAGTIYVATQGAPNVIRTESPDGRAVIDYSEYGAPVTIEEPPADQVVDL
ncbi:hypothetical protein [Dactylosporangium sp. CS-033363]|uniref:hypothetical protein n=1 Tax=Dactylosporangium sp. CS-033363 TaxID=3239935 RepID=UPI003D8DD5E7